MKCGRPMMRDRNLFLERRLGQMAAEAAGFTDTGGLDAFADGRAHPGGVRVEMDRIKEAREEIADCRNYLVWAIEPLWEAYLAGERDAGKEVAKLLSALTRIVAAWHDLR